MWTKKYAPNKCLIILCRTHGIIVVKINKPKSFFFNSKSKMGILNFGIVFQGIFFDLHYFAFYSTVFLV